MNIKYDEYDKTTPEWKSLYARWRFFRQKGLCGPEFDDFTTFYDWSLASGFELGFTLRREDISKPFSPDNCYWYDQGADMRYKMDQAWVKKWNETVNRIRTHYGMPLIGIEEEKKDGE